MPAVRCAQLSPQMIHEWKNTLCVHSKYKEDLVHIRDMHRLLSYKGMYSSSFATSYRADPQGTASRHLTLHEPWPKPTRTRRVTIRPNVKALLTIVGSQIASRTRGGGPCGEERCELRRGSIANGLTLRNCKSSFVGAHHGTWLPPKSS